jgi:hypothetical protein
MIPHDRSLSWKTLRAALRPDGARIDPARGAPAVTGRKSSRLQAIGRT